MKLQDYLISEKMTVKQKRNIFLFRVRMADYGENYPSRSILPIPCLMCHLHRDCQAHSVSCQETMKNVRTRGNYNEIFSNSISENTAIMIEEIIETRNKQAELSWREEQGKQAELSWGTNQALMVKYAYKAHVHLRPGHTRWLPEPSVLPIFADCRSIDLYDQYFILILSNIGIWNR